MQSVPRLILCGAFLLAPLSAIAQQVEATPLGTNAPGSAGERALLPDAPEPQMAAKTAAEMGFSSSVFESARQSESNAAQPAGQQKPADDERKATDEARKKAQQQINEQEHQRVLGILPAFNTSYRDDAVSLTAKEKISLAFHSAVDPITFATAFVVAGLHEGLDDDPGFGWGADGYFKRSGAAYLDTFDGTMIGNGFLPALLHQDPRYFRMGHGSAKRRLLHAMAATVICKHDDTGKWEPNYSNVGGNIISGAISNYYYPSSDSGFGQTIGNGMIVTAEGTLGSVFQEFWPDISRKWFHKDPTNGLDAQAREADEGKKKKEKQPLAPEK